MTAKAGRAAPSKKQRPAAAASARRAASGRGGSASAAAGRSAASRADAHRRRPAPRTRARRAAHARHPADLRPAARKPVQHPRPRPRRSGHRRARARPVRRHRRARARGDVARRGVRAVRRRGRGGARADPRERGRRSGSAASPTSSGATPPSSAPRIRSSRSRSCSSIRPMAAGSPSTALISARAGGWLAPDALIVVEEAADAAFTAPEGFAEIERRRYDDTELVFLRLRIRAPTAATSHRHASCATICPVNLGCGCRVATCTARCTQAWRGAHQRTPIMALLAAFIVTVVLGDLAAVAISYVVEQFSKPVSLFVFCRILVRIALAARMRSASVHAHAAGAHRRAPFVELAHHELAEIVRGAPLRQRRR